MQQHYTNQKPDERFAVASWWKWSWDEDRVVPAEARRHRRWSQAGLVSVDHDGQEWWNLERPGVCDIPCTSEVLLSQATEFYSRHFLEALKSSTCRSVSYVTFGECIHVHVRVAWNTFLHFFFPFSQIWVPKCHTMPCVLVLLSISMLVW